MVSTAKNKQQIPQRELNLYPIDYPFEMLVNKIDEKPTPSLILNYAFRGNYKWTEETASRFIESCLMQIPLPSCYFAEDGNRNHLVIDGLNRINSVYRFIKNEFAFTGLTVYPELNNLYFKDLDPIIQKQIKTYTIRCIVFRNKNDRFLLVDVVNRVNQGAVRLTSQEIRHALYPGTLDDLLAKLSQLEEIRKLVSGMGKNRQGEELVIRFFALNNNLDDYNDNLSDYLNRYMFKNQDLSVTSCSEMETLFQNTLEKCRIVFDNEIFKNLANQSNRRGKSIAIYDTQMYSLQNYSREFIEGHRTEIYSKFKEMCNEQEFQKTLSGGLVKKSSILARRQVWASKLELIK
ncbi:protein of unknown function DUF262 [Thalassoporum mexicanum PCC 7367]|uniref:DUF262 domain-containing protein n=1 Tax=Thalassoporum mexicanum TaxID=3457544 RepID=UPI00029FDF1C|nr:DUF262 domain-containing protein [Pseudanabaena sp. PCC 7367]AFY68736.1 protein of unknown function DUF262 [Pseudanabaena sp. PCC 7367]